MTMVSERTAAAPSGPRASWILPGLLLGGLPFAVAAVAPSRPALLILAATLGAAALAALLVFMPQRTADGLFLGFVGLISIPLGKYFFYRPHVGGWPGLRFSVSDAFLLLSVPLLVAGLLWRRRRNALPATVLLLYGLLMVQYAVSLVLSPSHLDLGFLELASALHALFLAFATAAFFRRALLAPFLVALSGAVSLHSLFALLQAASGRPIGRSWFHGTEVLRETLVSGTVRLRPSGLFDHPIVYADFLVLALPVLAAGFFACGGGLKRALIAGAFFLGTAGLILTLSRGAWISTALASGVFLFLAWRRGLLAGAAHRAARRALAGAAGLILVLGVAFGPAIYARLTQSQKGNVEVRYELNEIAFRMIESHPLGGVGLNSFIHVMERYDPRDVMRYFPATVHNLYLLETAESGIPGGLLFLLLFGAILASSLRRLRAVSDPALVWVAAALIAGFLGFAVSQVADFSHRIEPLRSIVWVHVGLLFGVLGIGSTGTFGPPSGPKEISA
jgi:hypothetical protein